MHQACPLIQSMQYIADNLAAGRRASKTRSDAWVLRGEGKTHRVLVDAGGTLTKFGRFYEEQTGQALERGTFDPDQEADREGNVETIRLRGGGRGIVRRFDPAAVGGQGRWKYTALGRVFLTGGASRMSCACLPRSMARTREGRPTSGRVSSRLRILSSCPLRCRRRSATRGFAKR